MLKREGSATSWRQARYDLIRQLQRVNVLLKEGDRQALVPVGLTTTQVNLLRCLSDGPCDVRTVSQLASSLLCTPGNAARLVRRLGEAGLVATRCNDRDQRLVVVSPYRCEGKRLLRSARRRLAAASRRRLAALSECDVTMMIRLARDLA